MYRTFSVAVSVAGMFLKKLSVERFCKTKIRTKFRDSPCEIVYEFCVLHIFVVCAGQVHVRHDPISRIFLRQFISRTLQVSRPKLRKFVRSFALHDVERKFVRIFVLQNLSSDSFCFIRDDSMSWCGLESFAVEEIYSYVYWRNNCVHWLK